MPPHPLSRGGACLVLFVLALCATAQEVVLNAEGGQDSIVVAGLPAGSTNGKPLLRAVWAGMDGPSGSFSFHLLQGQGQAREVALDELVVAGVEQYLDQRIHFNKIGVTIDLPVDRMVEGINRMVATAAQRFGASPVALSPATRQQLQRVSRIDWSKATFGVDGGEDQEKYLAIYYYVRSQRQELERQLRNDLLPLSGVAVLGPATTERADPGRTDSVPTVCSTVFDDQNFLCPLDLKPDSAGIPQDVQLTNDLLANIMASAQAAKAVEEPKLRKRDRWLKAELDAINGRIDKMDQRKELWALRDRMDAVEGRIDALDTQVEELRPYRPQSGKGDNPIANLSALTGRNIAVYFAVGAATVGGTDRALLEEVAREMGRSPRDRVLITGYADATGDPSRNLELSERRAKAVRAVLLGYGIAPDRLLLNYYGSGHSSGADAAQRRVEIEWLQ